MVRKDRKSRGERRMKIDHHITAFHHVRMVIEMKNWMWKDKKIPKGVSRKRKREWAA